MDMNRKMKELKRKRFKAKYGMRAAKKKQAKMKEGGGRISDKDLDRLKTVSTPRPKPFKGTKATTAKPFKGTKATTAKPFKGTKATTAKPFKGANLDLAKKRTKSKLKKTLDSGKKSDSTGLVDGKRVDFKFDPSKYKSPQHQLESLRDKKKRKKGN